MSTTIKKQKSSEKRLGYLLIAPAMILIFVIAIWPVIQSFYFSMFDYKLNDPTKSSVHLGYSLDLGNYLNNYPFLMSDLDKKIQDATSSNKNKYIEVKKQLTQIDRDIKSRSALKKRYDKINKILDNFNTPSSKLAIVSINKKTATLMENTFDKTYNVLKKLSDTSQTNKKDKLVGLSSSLRDSIIRPNFIGLQHYKHYLTDSRMWHAIGNTMTFTMISVLLELVLGLAIALLINKAFFGRGLIRATILIPWAIPTAVSALMWKYLYDGQNGIVAKYFSDIGIIHNMSTLLASHTGAMFSVIFADVWKTTPYMALLLLAGLQTIPSSLYEASAIDGANKWKQFTTITLPLLKSSILVALIFRTLDAFRVFDLIYVLTGGGPANSTESISIMAYKVMFSQTNFGGGSALSVIVFFCVAIISAIYIKFLGSDLIADGAKR